MMRTSNSLSDAMRKSFKTFVPNLLIVQQPVLVVLVDKIMRIRRKPWNDKTSRMTGLDLNCQIVEGVRVESMRRVNGGRSW
jgi:hypothetical protein